MKRIGVLSILLVVFVGGLVFSQANQTDDLIGKVFTLYYPANNPNFSGLSRELRDANLQTIDAVIQILTENPRLRVRVVGYANAVADTAKEEAESLLPLSRQRAKATADILGFYGIPDWRILASGLGGKYPLAPKFLTDELYRNRRVELTIIR
jgi:outer membrane protein OmpA-like peptidoglycan-associated protein